MNLAEVTQKAQTALADAGFSNTVKFDFGDIGKLFLDGPNAKANNEDAPADATVNVSWEDFQGLMQGTLDPMMAFMQGKVKVAGDMSVAMKLQQLFSKLR